MSRSPDVLSDRVVRQTPPVNELLGAEDAVNDGVDIGDINLAVEVGIIHEIIVITRGDCIDKTVHICNVDLSVVIHIGIAVSFDIDKLFPSIGILVF